MMDKGARVLIIILLLVSILNGCRIYNLERRVSQIDVSQPIPERNR